MRRIIWEKLFEKVMERMRVTIRKLTAEIRGQNLPHAGSFVNNKRE
jgi:hypothetical protein